MNIESTSMNSSADLQSFEGILRPKLQMKNDHSHATSLDAGGRRQTGAQKIWKEPKIATFSKGVQVYEDILKQKYNWKPEFKNRMV